MTPPMDFDYYTDKPLDSRSGSPLSPHRSAQSSSVSSGQGFVQQSPSLSGTPPSSRSSQISSPRTVSSRSRRSGSPSGWSSSSSGRSSRSRTGSSRSGSFIPMTPQTPRMSHTPPSGGTPSAQRQKTSYQLFPNSPFRTGRPQSTWLSPNSRSPNLGVTPLSTRAQPPQPDRQQIYSTSSEEEE